MNLKRTFLGLAFAGLGGIAFLSACDPTAAGCESDLDCLSDEICFQNQCRLVCDDDDDCGANQECVPARDGQNVCMNVDAQTCAFDTQCGDGEVCVDNACTPTCTSEADCHGNTECRERPTGGESVCLPPADNGGEVQCETNEECTDAGIGDYCDAEGQCRFFGVEYYTVRIVDQTTGDRCNDTTHGHPTAGAKLIYIALLDADDQVLAYADTVEFFEGTGAFFGNAEDVINGEPPSLEGHCPTVETVTRDNGTEVQSNFREDAVVALGCDGEIFVQFRGEDGGLLHFDEGNRIEVNAYGLFCSEQNPGTHRPQSQEDPYNVEICTDSSQANIDIATCHQLNTDPARGRTFWDVQFAE